MTRAFLGHRSSVRAFSLTELMVVIGIVAALVAIVTPVFVRARKSARFVTEISNLRQVYVAVALYQADHSSENRFSHPLGEGLPSRHVFGHGLNLPEQLRLSVCGSHPARDTESPNPFITYWPTDGKDVSFYSGILGEFEGRSPLVTDDNCTDPDVPLYNPKFLHRGLGVRIDGSLVNRIRKGRIDQAAWWSN